MKQTTKDKPIMRFPRLAEDYPNEVGHLSQLGRTKLRVAQGITPKGYRTLSNKQKKIARLVLSGQSVASVCQKYHMDDHTFYRWLHCHKLFQKYYYRIAQRRASLVDLRLEAKLPRAVQIVEESLDSRDPYFAKETAMELLKGRGKLKHNVQTKNETTGTLTVDAKVESLGGANEGMREMAVAFLEAMASMGMGTKLVQPKVIDVKELPAATVEALRERSQVQESRQEATVGKD